MDGTLNLSSEIGSLKKQESEEFVMVRKRRADDYHREFSHSLLFPLAIVFCVLCIFSTGNFVSSPLFAPASVITAGSYVQNLGS